MLQANVNELYRNIGAETTVPELGVKPLPDSEKERQGHRWFQEHRKQIQELVCQSYVVQAYLTSSRLNERVLLVAAIADLISSLLSGVAAISVAVLVVREGLKTLCETD